MRGASAPMSALAHALALLTCGTVLSACTALEEWNQPVESPTGGVTMSLSIARPDQQQYEIFKVTRLGDLEYGGGLKAFNDHTDWSGPMSKEEIAKFLSILDANRWCSEAPPEDPSSSSRCRIEVRCTEERHTYTLKGVPETAVTMRNFLEPIARRRFQEELDRLPEANEPKSPPTPPTPPPAPAPAPKP